MTAAMKNECRPQTQSARLLLIDDDPTTTHMLGILLQRNGYTTAAVNDSREALAAIRQFRPDVILLDINMPIFSGYHIAQAVRADPELEKIPIVAVTSLDDEEHLRRSLEVGITYQITKPFYTDELNDVIDQLALRH